MSGPVARNREQKAKELEKVLQKVPVRNGVPRKVPKKSVRGFRTYGRRDPEHCFRHLPWHPVSDWHFPKHLFGTFPCWGFGTSLDGCQDCKSRGSAERMWVEFFLLVWLILGKRNIAQQSVGENYSGNFGALFSRVSEGTEKAHKLFQHKLFGPHPKPSILAPQKKVYVPHFLGKNAKRDPHKLFREEFLGQKRGPKQAIFRHKKFSLLFRNNRKGVPQAYVRARASNATLCSVHI